MPNKLKMRCFNPRSDIRCSWGTDYYCSGRYQIYKHSKTCPVWIKDACNCYVKLLTWVGAHEFPVWVQCSGCGEAPHKPEEQIALLGKILYNLKKSSEKSGRNRKVAVKEKA